MPRGSRYPRSRASSASGRTPRRHQQRNAIPLSATNGARSSSAASQGPSGSRRNAASSRRSQPSASRSNGTRGKRPPPSVSEDIHRPSWPITPSRTSAARGMPPPSSSLMVCTVEPQGVRDGDLDVRQEPELDMVDEVIMAIDLREKSTIGCAYFSTTDATLYIAEDIPMAKLDVAEQLVIHIQPTTLLVSCRAPEDFVTFLDKMSQPDQDGKPAGFILRSLASSEFSNSTALERLANLRLDNYESVGAIVSTAEDAHMAGNFDDVDGNGNHDASRESHLIKLLRCGSLINLDSNTSITCAGAVVADLHRRRSIEFLPDGQNAEVVFCIHTMRMFSLSEYMFVSAETLLSLQIVQSELHPNSQVWGPDPSCTGTKESLSVYGLFHMLACTPQGRSSLRQMFLRPTLNMDTIAERHRTISLFVRPDNVDNVAQLVRILRKVKNMRTVIGQLQKGVDSPSTGRSFDRGVWATLRGFAAQILRVREIVHCVPGYNDIEVLRQLVEAIQPAIFVTVGDLINRTIDFNQSKSRHRPSVKAGIDPQLDELKRQYDGMDSFLTEVVNHVNQRLPEWARQYIRSCIFLPQLGFLMVVEPDSSTGNGRYEGEGSGDDRWERLFTADGAVCYKNRYMKELDDQYGDMYCEIGDREVEIIHVLAMSVLEHGNTLVKVSDLCGKFDALLALAIGAEKYQWVAPQITTVNTLQIKAGRHPLQELVVPSFVPNDCRLTGLQDGEQNDNFPRALILTGPNHSGKSIYLKQTAIIVYLAHIGSFVPAEQAIIGLTDKILTRISTRESVSRNESAFAIDLKQVAQAARCATARSLVLVDEFGKGTNSDDGAGLLAAMLDHFLTSGSSSPRLLLATHFHELFEGGYLEDLPGLGLAHMDVLTDWEAATEDQVTYLFRLTPGHNSSSFGGRCAALNGVPSAIVDRAEAISQLLSRNEDLSSACAELTTEEEKKLQDAEGVARRFLQGSFGDMAGDGSAIQSILTDLLRC